jgi:hypothetical protein
MIRRLIPKIGSIRYINKADLKQSFDNRLKIKNKLALKDFYGENKKDRHVLVYDHEGIVICVLVFDDKGDHFYLNLIENNQIHTDLCNELNPAPNMIRFVENFARSIGHTKIRLYSLEQLVWYYEKSGYVSTGKTNFDPNYGVLIEMKKLLGS